MSALSVEDFAFAIPRSVVVRKRREYLIGECLQKRVVHIGCVDSGLLAQRLQTGQLLHNAIAAVATKVVGFDIDENGVTQMKAAGLQDVFLVNVSTDESQAIDIIRNRLHGCDVIICGEVLEHVADMGSFLLALHNLAKEFGAALILTVPNAHSLRGFLQVLLGTEKVHPDHNCYFSWATIGILLTKVGFMKIERLFYLADLPAQLWKRVLIGPFASIFYPAFPQLADGLIIVCKVAEE